MIASSYTSRSSTVGTRLVALVIAVQDRCACSEIGALERYPPEVFTVRSFVDNFDPSSNDTFEQRYLVYDKWWRRGGPILLYLGNEGAIEGFYDYTGAVFEHAEALQGLVAFVEHRYYGRSQPYGENPSRHELRGLTVEQAMADYAWFISHFTSTLGCRKGECPVITFGGSYGGMLVAWFRQKYPQLTVGGVGCGAVIDFFAHDGRQQAFWNATQHTFAKFGSAACARVVNTALLQVQEHARTESGRRVLQRQLNSCDPLSDEETAGEKIDFFVRGVLSSLAMLDYTEASAFVTPLPANPVSVACNALEAISDKIMGLKSALDLYLNSTGAFRCYDFMAEMVGKATTGKLAGPVVPPDMGPWQYQACSELILQTLTSDGFGFYPAADAQLQDVAAACELRYGVVPRPSWLSISLGGSDLRVGNLFFTDGEKDPWSAGSIRLSKVRPGLDIQHIVIPGAAHHEDLRFNTDPPRAEVLRAKLMARAAMWRWIENSSFVPAVLV